MEARPEQHTITTNDWELNKFEIRPTAVGSGGTFPTILGVLSSQWPSARIACFHNWEGFVCLFERKVGDIVEHPEGA